MIFGSFNKTSYLCNVFKMEIEWFLNSKNESLTIKGKVKDYVTGKSRKHCWSHLERSFSS